MNYPPDGSLPTRLTFDPASDLTHTWSPDGTQIAFRRGASPQIYVTDLNTNVETQLPPLDARRPDWSPDGNKIYFDSGPGNSSEIYVIDLNTNDVTQLTFNSEADDADPTVSPDGTKLHGRVVSRSSGY